MHIQQLCLASIGHGMASSLHLLLHKHLYLVLSPPSIAWQMIILVCVATMICSIKHIPAFLA